MSFTVAKIETIKSKINISVPGDMGTIKKSDFVVEYRKIGLEEAEQLMDEVRSGAIDDVLLLSGNIVNIEGLKNPDGSDLEYSAELMPTLGDMDYVRKPLVDGFMAVQFGREVLKQKN